MSISPQAFAFLKRVLTKLNEKSSVYGYVALVTSVVFKQWAGDAGNIAAIISATAGVVLFVISDAQVSCWVTGQKVAPQSQDKSESTNQG